MKKILLLTLPCLVIVGCSKSGDSAQSNTAATGAAPGPAVATTGGAGGGGPQAKQGGHFSNPDAKFSGPGTALGK